MIPLAPSGYAYGYKKRMKKKTVLIVGYLMFNLPLIKSSQQRKTTRYCSTPKKSSIVVFETNAGRALISVENLRQS